MNNTTDRPAYKLIVVDDHQLFLDGLTMILGSVNEFKILQSASDGFEALNAIETQKPDVILTDINMPGMDGLQLVRKVKAMHPEIKILVLSMVKDRDTVEKILDAEAEGFILKNANKSELVQAIKTIGNGDTYYSREIMQVMMTKYKNKEKLEEAKMVLTPREVEIIQLIAEEMSSEKIAEQLFISLRTVETHRKNILAKTNTTTVVGLLKYAMRHNLIQFR